MFPSCLSLSSSWTTSRSISIQTLHAQVYKLLTKVESWPDWDDGLEKASLDDAKAGAFNGAQGTLVMKERGAFRFTLVDLDASGYFAYDTPLKGVDGHWFWDFSQLDSDGRVVLEIGVTISGWAAPAWQFWFEKEANEAFERCCLNLKNILEAQK